VVVGRAAVSGRSCLSSSVGGAVALVLSTSFVSAVLEFIMRSILLFVCLRRGFGLSFSTACGHLLNAWGTAQWYSDMSTVDLFLLATRKS